MGNVSKFDNLDKSYSGLKILGFLHRGVPVQFRPRAPFTIISNTYEISLNKIQNLKKSQKEPKGIHSDDTMTPLLIFRASRPYTSMSSSRTRTTCIQSYHRQQLKSSLEKSIWIRKKINGGLLSKRFTDTDKWKRPWFRNLKLNARWVWLYLLDNCDHTGVWIADFELASFQLGFKFTESDLKNWLGEKLVKISSDKYFIPSFVEFQYGELKPENNAHKPVLKLLKKLGPMEPLTSPLEGAQDKDKDKEQDKDKVQAKDNELKIEIEKIYKEIYPLKKGKSKGVSFIVKDLRPNENPEMVRKAALKFKNDVQANKTEKKFIKHFSTWAHEWRDWLDEDAGASVATIKNYENERDTDHDAEVREMWKT